MMRFLAAAAILIPALLFCLSCDDDTVVSDQPETYAFTDYIWIDTASFLTVKATGGANTEPYLDGDYIIGEPFIDQNGNGVYDNGVDIFIMCACDSNQDLNRNGRHDGPDDPYTTGTPYDDLNADGTYSAPNGTYEVGEPFYDYDGDSTRDANSLQTMLHNVVKAGVVESAATATVFQFYYRDSLFAFVSDSGRKYVWPQRSAFYWNPDTDYYRRYSDLAFTFNAAGLEWTREGMVRLLVAERGPIVPGAARVPVAWLDASVGIYDTVTMVRSVEVLPAPPEVGGTAGEVLEIRFDTPLFDDSAVAPYTAEAYFEFYFSADYGFGGVEYNSADFTGIHLRHIEARHDSLPLPMIRLRPGPRAAAAESPVDEHAERRVY